MTYAIERLFDEIEEKALEKGRNAGIKEGVVNVIKNLKLISMSDELISQCTGLSIEEVKKINPSA